MDVAMIAGISGALTQAVKRALPEQYKRFMPLVAAVIGMAASLVLSGGQWQNPDVWVMGLAGGLGSVGLWEAGKHSVMNK